MGKKRLGVCSLCGNSASLTKEHFVPRCLWSGARPPETETVYACENCNENSNEDDDYFRNILVLMFDQNHPEKKILFETKVKRSLAKKPGIARELLGSKRIRPMYSACGQWLGSYPMLEVDADRVDRSLRKVFKGLYYIIKRKPFPKDGELLIISELNAQTKDAIDAIEKHLNPTFSFGDDIFEWSFFQTRDGITGWRVAFYRSVLFYALGIDPVSNHTTSTATA